jgi:hypothetical protein
MVRPHWERVRVRDAPRVNFRSDFGGSERAGIAEAVRVHVFGFSIIFTASS